MKENAPVCIKQKKAEKRLLRERWQQTRYSADKTILNRAIRDLKEMLNEAERRGFQEYLESLGANEASDYSLWESTWKLKRLHQLTTLSITDERNNKFARNDKEKAFQP